MPNARQTRSEYKPTQYDQRTLDTGQTKTIIIRPYIAAFILDLAHFIFTEVIHLIIDFIEHFSVRFSQGLGEGFLLVMDNDKEYLCIHGNYVP